MELQNGLFFGRARGRRTCRVATLTETAYASGDRVPEHSHESAFFCLVVEGSMEERFDGAGAMMGEGHVLFHPAGLPHGERFPDVPTRVFNIQPEGTWLSRLRELDLEPAREQLRSGSTGRLTWLARQVRAEWRRADGASPLAVEGLVLQMLAEVLRASGREPEPDRPPWLLRVRNALHASIRDPVTILELARSENVDPAHLSRTFRDHFGCPPGEYRRRLRVEAARRALEECGKSLSRVALEAGFTDQSHLTRTFRRYLGTTPGAYRDAPGGRGGDRSGPGHVAGDA